jgi:hypothetical protein
MHQSSKSECNLSILNDFYKFILKKVTKIVNYKITLLVLCIFISSLINELIFGQFRTHINDTN